MVQASRLKAVAVELCTTSQLPAHQRAILWSAFQRGKLSGLRRRSLSFLILIASALLLAPPSSRAETTLPINSQSCGATVEDNLAAAKQAISSNDTAMHAALACLIEATIALNRRVHNDEDGHPASGVLHLPMLDVPPRPSK